LIVAGKTYYSENRIYAIGVCIVAETETWSERFYRREIFDLVDPTGLSSCFIFRVAGE